MSEERDNEGLHPAPVRCSECLDGFYREELQAIESVNQRFELLIIPAIPTLVCDHCGSAVFSSESCLKIERFREAIGCNYNRKPRTPNDQVKS